MGSLELNSSAKPTKCSGFEVVYFDNGTKISPKVVVSVWI